ncbi:MAG: glycosyltransferase [Burkholderiales bacterium]|nr:glycosyltransferase [Burkholderiales bacterium]
MPLLTVLICTHNRADLLQRTLAALDAAERPPEGVQVLVVANRCSDGTHTLLDAAARPGAGRLPLRWMAEPQPGKSHALNRALPEIDTPLVVFVDDDQRPDPRFLVAIRDAARDLPQADLLCGRLLPDWDGTEPAWVHDQGPYRIYPLPVPHFDQGPQRRALGADGPVPSGGNLVARCEWLGRVGLFSTDLGPVGHDLGGAEDSDWITRAQRLGATLHYDPAIVQRHHVESERLALGYLMRKAYKRTAANIGLHGAPAGGARVPLFVYRKLLVYLATVLTSPGAARRRFYLMRSAAALGELSGYRRLAGSAGAARAAR